MTPNSAESPFPDPKERTSADGKKSDAAKELCENEPFFAKPYDVKRVVARIRTLIDAGRKKGAGP